MKCWLRPLVTDIETAWPTHSLRESQAAGNWARAGVTKQHIATTTRTRIQALISFSYVEILPFKRYEETGSKSRISS